MCVCVCGGALGSLPEAVHTHTPQYTQIYKCVYIYIIYMYTHARERVCVGEKIYNKSFPVVD